MKTKQHKDNMIKGRAEARPKKVMELFGWTISVEERQYITKSKKEDNRYFSTLENAIWHIAEQSEKLNTYSDLKDAVKQIKETKERFLQAFRKELTRQG